MAQSDNAQQINTLTQFVKDLRALLQGTLRAVKKGAYWLLDFIDPFIHPLFQINLRGRIIRSFIFPLGWLIWTLFAYAAHPPDFDNIQPWVTFPEPEDFAAQLMISTLLRIQLIVRLLVVAATPYFEADILRRVLVIGLAFWVAFRTAAIYLDDIFELGDVSIAADFIRIAAFVGRYPRVQIRNGEIPADYRDSPVFRIGGPGKVLVHIENVALFEKIDGEPHVIFPEDGYVELEGFERLRAIYDMRDQFVDNQTVESRTKDGIKVKAKNINMVFSVHRGQKPDHARARAAANTLPPTTTDSPNETPPEEPQLYYDKQAVIEAIMNLTYKQTKQSWTRRAINNILARLRTFIAGHTLDEFLANISPQELAAIRQKIQEQFPNRRPKDLTLDVSTISEFIARDYITRMVQGEPGEGKKRGFDIYWVGVGTWDTPTISEKHLEAWEQTVKNRIEGNEYELAQIRRKSRLDELRRIIQDIPINAFGALRKQENLTANEIKYKLMLAYREKLKNARDLYVRNGQQPPSELVETINLLDSL